MKKVLMLLIYLTVCGEPQQLDQEVNYQLAHGWKLQGCATSCYDNVRYVVRVCQTLVKGGKP